SGGAGHNPASLDTGYTSGGETPPDVPWTDLTGRQGCRPLVDDALSGVHHPSPVSVARARAARRKSPRVRVASLRPQSGLSSPCVLPLNSPNRSGCVNGVSASLAIATAASARFSASPSRALVAVR